MFYVYVLKSLSNSRPYIGLTSDLRKRVAEHDAGYSTFTKSGRPWMLMYYEAFKVESFARQREKKLKQYGKRWGELKKRIGFELDNDKEGAGTRDVIVVWSRPAEVKHLSKRRNRKKANFYYSWRFHLMVSLFEPFHGRSRI